MHYGLPENGELLIYTQITNYDCGSGQITDSDIQISTGIYFLALKFQAQLSKMSSSRVRQKRSTLTKLCDAHGPEDNGQKKNAKKRNNRQICLGILA